MSAPLRPPAFGALRSESFRLFVIGQFLSLSGTWMQVVAQGWLVVQLSPSPFLVGVVAFLESLPILLFTLYGGVLADRVRRRRALMILQSLMLLESLILATLTAFDVITLPLVMILAFSLGTLAAFEVPIRQAFLLEMVEREDVMNAIALNSLTFNSSRIVGPLIAAALIASIGLKACFFANSLSYLAVIFSLAKMRPKAEGATNREAKQNRNLADGLAYLQATPLPRTLLMLTAAFSVFGFSFVAMLPVYARDVLKAGASGYGGLMSAFGVGAAAGALTMAAFGGERKNPAMIRWAGFVFGFCLAGLGLVAHFPSAMLLLAVAGAGMILNNVITNTLLQTTTPDHLRGRVMGFYSLVVLGLAPIGNLLVGWGAEKLGVAEAVGLGGVACIIATLFGTKRLADLVSVP